MSALALFFTDTVTVETYLGQSAYGGGFADPTTVACYVDDSTHLAVGTDGREVISNTIIYAEAATGALFPVDSKVTVNGRVARVITLNNYNSGPVGLPQHVEVHLT